MNQDQIKRLHTLFYGVIGVVVLGVGIVLFELHRLPIGCDMNSDDILTVKDVLLLAEQVQLK